VPTCKEFVARRELHLFRRITTFIVLSPVMLMNRGHGI
jgi:hypothetical protein